MSGVVTGCVSATVTAVNPGFSSNYVEEWLRSWSIAFPVGFGLLLLISPFLKRTAETIVTRPNSTTGNSDTKP
ncbi:DUF2798 domain-containing protein [Nitrosomonas sp. Nm51]|uniref:DUF2798 domain-containing protein n=1 Tax=Nitrosomonas sp. Nm51 TaxID=133720 RepID=UPI000B8859B6|nr:DUF2798 domain-containing protein [Nitrosomonas sp. Nm51]